MTCFATWGSNGRDKVLVSARVNELSRMLNEDGSKKPSHGDGENDQVCGGRHCFIWTSSTGLKKRNSFVTSWSIENGKSKTCSLRRREKSAVRA